MIDNFHGDATRLWFGEGTRSVAIERRPSFLIDFGFEGSFEGAIWIVCAQEVGVTNEEAFLVVVGINKPTGDAVSTVAAYLPGVRVKHIYTIHLYTEFAIFGWEDVDVGLTEDD